MRVLLHTGSGAAGTTTVAAATAVRAARTGRKTLLLTTGGTRGLVQALGAGDSAEPFGADLAEPVEVETGLVVCATAPARRFERSWATAQATLARLLELGDTDAVLPEELVLLPGVEELLVALELHEQLRSDRFDVFVLDLGHGEDALRLLGLPGTLAWYLRRLLPMEALVGRALRADPPNGGPLDGDSLVEAVTRLQADLHDLNRALAAADTTVRLVVPPDRAGAADARRLRTLLALHGLAVDAVVVNRLFPSGGGEWQERCRRAQLEALAELEHAFAGLPVHRVEHQAAEPVGTEALAGLAASIYAGTDPASEAAAGPSTTVERTPGGFVLALPLPLVTRSDLALARSGDDLVVTVGGARRVLALPSALRRCAVERAELRNDCLEVRFVPDPDLWRPL